MVKSKDMGGITRIGFVVENQRGVILMIEGDCGQVWTVDARDAEMLDFVDHRDRSEPDGSWMHRQGPCVITHNMPCYIDRLDSCMGCHWFRPGGSKYDRWEDFINDAYCFHPDMMEKYGCPQIVAGHGPKYILGGGIRCPAIDSNNRM